jgi:phosphoglycerate dehydrogenase-like enzyme
MKSVLKGIHAATREAVLRRKLAHPADIAACDGSEPQEALAAALADADVAVAMSWRAPVPPAPNLKLLQLPGAGLDGIDFSLVPEGAQVCNVFGHETGIAEYVLLAMLEWQVRLGEMNAAFKAGSWRHSLIRLGPQHGEVAGKTVGLIGYGHIGRAVAQRAKACAMRVVAITRTPPGDDANLDAAFPIARLHEALAQCDVVVLACPLTEATRNLIDGAALAAMRPHAVLINVARAAVVDEDALYEALSGGRIGGAVLDVWYRYPKPGGPDVRPSRRPFHELDNVIMTPHASAWTEGLIERRWTVIADNIARLADGRPLHNQVTRP